MEHKYQKQTKLLGAELRVIALTLRSRYCRDILNQAAERLEEIDNIAEFYRKEAEKNINGGTYKCSNHRAKTVRKE